MRGPGTGMQVVSVLVLLSCAALLPLSTQARGPGHRVGGDPTPAHATGALFDDPKGFPEKGAKSIRVRPLPPVQGVLDELAAMTGRLSVRTNGRFFGEGDDLQVAVEVPRDGYLNVLAVAPGGLGTVLHPNGFSIHSRVGRGRFCVPDDQTVWGLPAQRPFGRYLILALFSEQPINLYRRHMLRTGGGLRGWFATLSGDSLREVASLARRHPLLTGAAEVYVSSTLGSLDKPAVRACAGAPGRQR